MNGKYSIKEKGTCKWVAVSQNCMYKVDSFNQATHFDDIELVSEFMAKFDLNKKDFSLFKIQAFATSEKWEY